MRLRVVALAALVALWLPALLLLQRAGPVNHSGRTGETGYLPPGDLDEDQLELWRAENEYIVISGALRTTLGPELREQVPTGPVRSNDPIRLLVIGDSSTYGHGIADLDVRWFARLQTELDLRVGPDVFIVEVLAKAASSTLRHAEWVTAERVADLDPDLLILGFNVNDPVPWGDEQLLCHQQPCAPIVFEQTREYNNCAALGGDLYYSTEARQARDACFDAMRRDPRLGGLPTFAQLQDSPESGPYWELFTTALTTMRASAGNRPFLVVPVLGPGETLERGGAVRRELASRGYQIIDAPRSETAAASGEPDAQVDRFDSHPGPVVTFALARDVADAILANVPAERLFRAVAGHAPRERLLVSNYLPAAMRLEPGPEATVVLRYDAGDEPRDQLIAALERPMARYSPCAELGRPYARIMFDPRTAAGTNVAVDLLGGASAADVYAVGYDELGRRLLTSAGMLRTGAALQLRTGPELTGILIAPTTTTSCADELGPLTVELRTSAPRADEMP
jgi:hypothetical protein